MTLPLMPDPEAQRALELSYSEMRRLWTFEVLKLKRMGRRKRPEPGVIDLDVEDEG